MKVTGFTFIKNAIKYDFPVVESIRSILPLCDEVVAAVGDCDDNTREIIASIDPKIKIIDTVWDNHLREGGKVLAEETNKTFKAINDNSDWCFYIQGDEVLHEKHHLHVYEEMQKWKDHKKVDGFLFKYRHFYGSYDYIGASSKWYRNEIRIIRNDKSFYSYRDAQGFRKANNEKLNVKALDAYIYHYGWVREPSAMMAKLDNSSQFWGEDKPSEKNKTIFSGSFDYSQIDALEKFTGSHPAVMLPRIQKANWQFDYDISYNNLKWKDRLKNTIEKITGKRPFDYKNYKLI
ncbi:MAG: glycosyl transferase [Chitinophagaceae bacterium]|nr:glycosyl transferase [Chitinophagaceae bacterium]